MPLYHSTPYAGHVQTQGLQPAESCTRVAHLYDNHFDAAVRAKAATHRGLLTFATDDEMESLLGAFRVVSDRHDPYTFGRGVHAITSVLTQENNMASHVGIVLVGNAAHWQRAIAELAPTRFHIKHACEASFQPVLDPDGVHYGEYMSRQAVPPRSLVPEEIALSRLSGRVEFFECDAAMMPAYASRPYHELWANGLIRPVNHLLGLPPTRVTDDEAPAPSRMQQTVAAKPSLMQRLQSVLRE